MSDFPFLDELAQMDFFDEVEAMATDDHVERLIRLAQEIRRVDGNHDKGAAALAEALMPFLDRWIRQAYMDGRNDEAQWAPQDRADEREKCRAELRAKVEEIAGGYREDRELFDEMWERIERYAREEAFGGE